MSFNSSFSLDLLTPQSFSDNLYLIFLRCFNTREGIINLGAFIVINLLVVLPLCALILHFGVGRWLRGSGTAASHSDHLTFNLILTELLILMGFVLTWCGVFAALPLMGLAGTYIFSLNLFAHVVLDILTCVERYLAVVHPITYRNLKNAKGIRIRTTSIACVWLLCVTEVGLLSLRSKISTAIVLISFTAVSLIAVCFCSLTVLYALVHPGPGDRRRHVEQPKLRAFYTILAILAVMMIRLGASVITSVFYASSAIEEEEKCHFTLFLLWTYVPTSLLPLILFLHRAGKMLCCKFKGKNDSSDPANTTKSTN